jgi:hypothetical protein
MIRYLGENYSQSYDPILMENRDENKMLEAAEIQIRDNLRINTAFKVKLDGVEGYAYIIHQGNIAEFSSIDVPELKVIKELGKIEAATSRELIQAAEAKRKKQKQEEQQKQSEEFQNLEKDRIKKRNAEKTIEFKNHTSYLQSLNIIIKDYPKNPLEYIEKSMGLYSHYKVFDDLKKLEKTDFKISNITVGSIKELRTLIKNNILQNETYDAQQSVAKTLGIYPDVELTQENKLFTIQLKNKDGKPISELSISVSELIKEHTVTAYIEGDEEVRGSNDQEWDETFEAQSIDLEHDEHSIKINGIELEDLTDDIYENPIYQIYEHLLMDTVFYNTEHVHSEIGGNPSLHEKDSLLRHVDIDLIDSKKEQVILNLIEHLSESISLEKDNGLGFTLQAKEHVAKITKEIISKKPSEKPQ